MGLKTPQSADQCLFVYCICMSHFVSFSLLTQPALGGFTSSYVKLGCLRECDLSVYPVMPPVCVLNFPLK